MEEVVYVSQPWEGAFAWRMELKMRQHEKIDNYQNNSKR